MYSNREPWSEIRRRVLAEGLSKREACRQYDLHWQTLKEILSHEEPPGYRRAKPPKRPTVEGVLPAIREILDADAKAPKKPRHTAKRIFERLRAEHAYPVGYTSVKDAVREIRAGRQEVFLPLSHPPGEAQVDFGFAEEDLAGVRTKVALFVMSLPYSDAVYCRAFPRECTEVFQEGHVRAFAFFGGVPKRIAYDNTKTAVARIVGPRERELTREFLRLKSHCLFDSHFRPVRRPNGKGHVERLVVYLDNGPSNSGRRTQWLKRMVQFADWSGLEVRLVPYHGKYDPVECCWSAPERKYRGVLLDSVGVILWCARRMT